MFVYVSEVYISCFLSCVESIRNWYHNGNLSSPALSIIFENCAAVYEAAAALTAAVYPSVCLQVLWFVILQSGMVA